MYINPAASHQKKPAFIPAKPAGWLIRAAQEIIRSELTLNDKLYFDEQDLNVFAQLPPGSGIILTSNHADETDPRVCLELSRRAGKRFITMCNREAFDEMLGLAGWFLQRLGLFSVRRGAHDSQAKSYATKIVMGGRDVLVIFPEGEIFYLNEKVQPFHSGAIDICLQAILENRKSHPSWTAYIVPMVIKYDYSASVESVLEQRITKMEAHLSVQPTGVTLQERLFAIQTMLLKQEQVTHQVNLPAADPQSLTQEIILTENAILSDIEKRYPKMPVGRQVPTIDKAWQLGAELSEVMDNQSDQASQIELRQDLASLKEIEQLSSWRPHYYFNDPSPDRLAEGLLKVERELYKINRPRPLASRNVTVKIAEPIEMGKYLCDYMQDAHAVRHSVTQQLHEQIQSLIDNLRSQRPNPNPNRSSS